MHTPPPLVDHHGVRSTPSSTGRNREVLKIGHGWQRLGAEGRGTIRGGVGYFGYSANTTIRETAARAPPAATRARMGNGLDRVKELISPGVRVVRGIRTGGRWVNQLAFRSRMPAVVAKISVGPVSGRKRV